MYHLYKFIGIGLSIAVFALFPLSEANARDNHGGSRHHDGHHHNGHHSYHHNHNNYHHHWSHRNHYDRGYYGWGHNNNWAIYSNPHSAHSTYYNSYAYPLNRTSSIQAYPSSHDYYYSSPQPSINEYYPSYPLYSVPYNSTLYQAYEK